MLSLFLFLRRPRANILIESDLPISAHRVRETVSN